MNNKHLYSKYNQFTDILTNKKIFLFRRDIQLLVYVSKQKENQQLFSTTLQEQCRDKSSRETCINTKRMKRCKYI